MPGSVQALCLFTLVGLTANATQVRLPATPALTPDGATLVFEWQEDLWTVPVSGGQARALTRHPAMDRFPVVSPDGTSVAFMSNRDSTYQTWIIPLGEGEARQVTRHSEGSGPQDWFPDGRRLVVRGARDSGDFLPGRFFSVDTAGAKAERQLFDEPGEWARVSPDGRKIVYMHGGDSVYRRGYRGSLAATIWMTDLETGTFTNLVRSADGAECRWPLWRPDGKAVYFVREDASRTSNLWEKDLATGEERQRTFMSGPGVFFPAISRDGSVVVFRAGFDFYRWSPADPAEPSRIQITAPPDSSPATTRRIVLNRADNDDIPGSVSFTRDADEVLFSAGGDLWVMDTELREPVPVTRGSDAQDGWAFFAPGVSNTVYFLRDTGDRCNVWKAGRADPSLPWWRNPGFTLTAVTDDTRGRSRLSPDPSGKRLAWVEAPGSLWVATPGGNDAVRVIAATGIAGYSWSPDSRWLVCSAEDSDDNHDVWIVSADGAQPPFNLSRHPDWDGNPEWSPDGRVIAWIGRRFDGTCPIHYAWLRREDRGRTRRDDGTPAGRAEKKDETVRIDFDGLAESVQAVDAGGGVPSGLFWSWDAKALAFRASREGREGTWKLFFPHPDKPEFMSATFGEWAEWTAKGIRWSVGGVPRALRAKTALHRPLLRRDESAWRRLALRKMWRTMRDEFYDEKLNHLDWNAVLSAYDEIAGQVDDSAFARLASMLFGELNASHLGFTPRRDGAAAAGWKRETGHPGVVFDPSFAGPGLLVRSVIAGSPADRDVSRLVPGDVVTHINGTPVMPDDDLCPLLEGPLPRDVLPFAAPGKHQPRRAPAAEHLRRHPGAGAQGRDRGRPRQGPRMEPGPRRSSSRRCATTISASSKWSMRKAMAATDWSSTSATTAVASPPTRSSPSSSTCSTPHHPRGGQPGIPGLVPQAPALEQVRHRALQRAHRQQRRIFSMPSSPPAAASSSARPPRAASSPPLDREVLDLGTFRIPHRLVLPAGRHRHGTPGAEPDIAVENPLGSRAAGFDPQLFAAVTVLLEDIKAAAHQEHHLQAWPRSSGKTRQHLHPRRPSHPGRSPPE
ncbi:MAG: DPP IV N-terminal domain-containing protein [Kiritimatiellia bacterium]